MRLTVRRIFPVAAFHALDNTCLTVFSQNMTNA